MSKLQVRGYSGLSFAVTYRRFARELQYVRIRMVSRKIHHLQRALWKASTGLLSISLNSAAWQELFFLGLDINIALACQPWLICLV